MKVTLEEFAFMPERAHKYDAGADLRAPYAYVIPANGAAIIDTGVSIQLPAYHVAFVLPRSGLMFREDITLIGTGTVDTGYTGSIKVKLENHTDKDYAIYRGDKIAQLVVMPIALPEFYKVDELDHTDRGANGLGSTGR